MSAEPDSLAPFIRRLEEISNGNEKTLAKLHWLNRETLKLLQEKSEHFGDATLTIVLEAIVRYVSASQYDDDYSGVKPEVFIESVVMLAPIVEAVTAAPVTARLAAARLSTMALHVSSSRTGTTDHAVLRGYVLKFKLGYAGTHMDGERVELRFLGQRFDLIAGHWALFEERGLFDKAFIGELEKLQHAAPALARGAL